MSSPFPPAQLRLLSPVAQQARAARAGHCLDTVFIQGSDDTERLCEEPDGTADFTFLHFSSLQNKCFAGFLVRHKRNSESGKKLFTSQIHLLLLPSPKRARVRLQELA